MVLSRSTTGAFVLALCFAAVPSPGAAQCEAPAHRAFDFWVGEWTVRTPDGNTAGVNRITREYNGCVLHERYTTDRGYSGESLNIYDAARNVWHQTWVDTSGTLLVLEGGLRDGAMVLESVAAAPGVTPVATRHRITWTPNADGTVRQFWQSTDKAGEWTTAFDGLYTRQPARE